jgi:uncharacterized membrane protein YhaH (DUF805 family)
MDFTQAIKSGFANYVNFSGRASRSAYWYWILFTVIGGIGTEILDTAIFIYHPGVSPLNSPLNALFTLVALLPTIAVAMRRLHDIDRTGWWMLLVFTGIGIFVLIFWDCQKGTAGANRFGPDPLAVVTPD